MTFKFRWLCELLDELDHHRPQQRATFSRRHDPAATIVHAWFKQHVHHISRTGRSATALLSALFPERRPDRSYGLKEKRLAQIFGRALGLSAGRQSTLKTWQSNQTQDFASCVEYVMGQAENPKPAPVHEVTLEEIDLALDEIASNMPGSAPSIRASHSVREAFEVLAPIILRLQSYEAKWFVRMIMKSYLPAEIPENVTQHAFHFLLPKLLLVQNSFDAAMTTLATSTIRDMPHSPTMEHELRLLPYAMAEIRPRLHTMIARQPYDKARSIKHCCQMSSGRIMSIERKYDGEYCQIHIDLSRGKNSIQIFSKSGKDSTLDRTVLHDAIRAGLRLGAADCRIKSCCIVEGEILVWSRGQKQILPFYHLRKHVLHGGRRIGNQADSPKRADENVMIVFYDILMLDEEPLMNQSHKRRRAHLKAIVKQMEGSVHLVDRIQINFTQRHAPQLLRKAFAKAIVDRWEGFVLKGVDDAYFAWGQSRRGIKLKKDYIGGLGDATDLCIVAGRRDAQATLALRLPKLHWTHFYLACLLNKAEARRYGAKPHFRIVDAFGPKSISREDILALNEQGRLCCTPFELELPQLLLEHRRIELTQPHHTFTRPMVVEVMGAGFERPQNTDYWILRFPRKIGSHTKLHQDRDVVDTVSFDELQEMAERCMREGPDVDLEEDAQWAQRLLEADPRSKYKDQGTPSTCTTPGKTPRTVTTASISPLNRWSRLHKSGAAVRIGSDSPRICSHAHTQPCKKNDKVLPDYHLARKRSLSTACTDISEASCKRNKQSSLSSANPSRRRFAFAENANPVATKPTTSTSQQQTTQRVSIKQNNPKQLVTSHQTGGIIMAPYIVEARDDPELDERGHQICPLQVRRPLGPDQHTREHMPNSPFVRYQGIGLITEHMPLPPYVYCQTIDSNTEPMPIKDLCPDCEPLQPVHLNYPPPQSLTPQPVTLLPRGLPKPLHLYIVPSCLSSYNLNFAEQHLGNRTPASFTTCPQTFANTIDQPHSRSVHIALISTHNPKATHAAALDLISLFTTLVKTTEEDNTPAPTSTSSQHEHLYLPVFDIQILGGRNIETLLEVLQGAKDVHNLQRWLCAVMKISRLGDGKVSVQPLYMIGALKESF